MKMYLIYTYVQKKYKEDTIMEKGKHLGLRIDSETHHKLKSLAKYDGRSINGEVLFLIRRAITQHEKEYGPIEDEPPL